MRIITEILLYILIFTSSSFASEQGFATNQEEITKGLTTPKAKFSFQITGEKQGTKRMHSVEVMEEEGGQLVKRSIFIFEDAPSNAVNLKIEFDVNSYTIRQASYPLLDELGKALLGDDLKSSTILVKGHTDSDGDEAMNLVLSCKRAMAVKSYLIEHCKISEERMKAIGYGEGQPIVKNINDYNKQINRRVEIERSY